MADNRKDICSQIAEDTKNDATNFDGQPFNGRTVAAYFGNHGAAIAALANLVKSLLEEIDELKESKTLNPH